jgi:hypothetical protein
MLTKTEQFGLRLSPDNILSTFNNKQQHRRSSAEKVLRDTSYNDVYNVPIPAMIQAFSCVVVGNNSEIECTIKDNYRQYVEAYIMAIDQMVIKLIICFSIFRIQNTIIIYSKDKSHRWNR